MDIVRWALARPVVVLVVCLASASTAFAQGATGTLTGTVVDSSGAAIPGATVNAIEEATGTVRTVVSSENGLFRMAALNPGRYKLSVELASFRTLTVGDINLLSTEVRDLGKLTLEVGTVTEVVSVTSEVTPVQVADSSRRSTITVDDIANIQTKGRDIFGLLAILPGVQDTNLNRDFAQWRSAISITINGMPSQAKDVRVDGLNIVDEGGCGTAFVNLNMDAIGEVQVISNGYTAENGRNNGGVISIVTKSGSGTLKASAWYNGRRDKFNENDYFREVANVAKPIYRVNISGYGIGGPVVIPGLVDSRSGKDQGKKFYFFASQEYTDDARPTTISRANMPTDLEKGGNFSQTRVTNGTIQPIIDPRTGVAFPGNIIPADRINPLGQRMLNLLPTANGITNPQTGQEWTSNSMYDLTPVHGRTNHVLRLDAVLSDKTRFNFRVLKDRDDDWSWNRITPGTGFINQNTPGLLLSTTMTRVVRPTIVNETSFGYTHNRWGFKAADDFDYRTLYRSTLGIDPPRFEPFGAASDPPELSGFGGAQVDEWPYAPRFSTTGGNRSNLGNYRVGNGNIQSADEPIPRLNLSGRFVFSNDTSITKGRHNFKMGVSLELNSKTEPGSADYMGNFDFGHNANNPLSTGNGYANMLLGAFTTYTELTSRVDRDVRHWQNDFYFQDNWRVTPRLTLDLGLRIQHSGSDYEINNMNSGFFADQWRQNQAARVYRLVCTTGVPGNQACATANQRAIDPAFPTVFLPSTAAGNLVPGTGSQINGIATGGLPDRKPGTYFTFPYFVYAPRVGFAWNMFGDGKTALRGSWGIFYNFPRSTGDGGGYPFSGGCPVSCTKQIRWATFNDITTATAANLVENPVGVTMAGYEQELARSQNVNVAFQRDIGFNTVAEIAYVGNFSRNQGRQVDVNRLPLYVFGDPNNLVNNAPISNNSLRYLYGQYPGMGSVNQYFPDLYSTALQYNAMQLQVTRRLSHGLQMGMAYTLAKGEGYRGYDPYTDEIGGEAAIRARYWGPTSDDRRHNLRINYSYDIPSFTEMPVVKQLLKDWQVSGVTSLLSGQAVTPSCTSNNPGVNNTDPSLSGLGTGGDITNVRCELTGEPLFVAYTGDPSVPEADRPHFNLAAFRMAQPNGAVGNFGNTPVGILRHPTWHSWDITLSRRFPITLAGRRNSGIKFQLQAYNVFNEVQFTNLNAAFQFTGPNNSVINSANTGKYTMTGSNLGAGTIPPRVLGMTVRLDW
jgi:Carboxypeptidase regulatory-like domain/TonB-dependent Receptor Plug Domain/TonB dependent receptor